MADLRVKYMGLDLKNPVIIGSSGLTDNLESLKILENNGAAAIVLKSIFEEEIIAEMDMNIKHMASENFLYPESLEYFENTYHNHGYTEKYLQLISDAKANLKIPIIASINCVTANEWTFFPKFVEQAGADALELNIFVLPFDTDWINHNVENVYFDIIEEINKQVSIPVSVKLSYYFSNLSAVINKISKSGVEGIVLFNRFYNPDIDINSFEIVSGNILSNPNDISMSLRWIALMSGKIKCDLAASTGVHDGQALIKQLLVGAKAVQIVSAIYEKGPEQIQKILTDLEFWMEKNKFKTINQFCGKMSQKNIKNPGAFERIQFMKYFRGY